GQICFGPDGTLDPAHKGKLGAEVSAEQGVAAARLCALNGLAQLQAAIGDLDHGVVQCVRLGGFINAVPSFAGLAPIMNGASDLM
ncbi:RidA family protein, partial [Staphylococcus aureus]|nr:RidA family protein [Staphylococcus aureus]